MNDDLKSFEARLRRQSLKPIPGDWRTEILQASRQAAMPENRRSVTAPPTKSDWLATLNQKLSTLFWPHPKAWAGLAAVWILILAVNFSTRDKAPVMAEKVSPPSPEVVAELKKQRQLFAELIGPPLAQDADRRKNPVPRPRSECTERLMA